MRHALRLIGSFTLLSLWAPAVFAAPLYERSVPLPDLESARPVTVLVPQELSESRMLASLRIMTGDTVVPHKVASAEQGILGGVIDTVALCSVADGTAARLYDGDTSTSVRPDPLQNPEACSLTLSFNWLATVQGVQIDADGPLSKLIGEARRSDGTFVELGFAEDVMDLSFSQVQTTALRVRLEYDTVPTVNEITVEGSIPPRLLFMPEPGQNYRVVYGDSEPPVVPDTAEDLFATDQTPTVSLGAERVIAGDADGDGLQNAQDNCPEMPNSDQADSDSDGLGDVCDNAPGIANAPQGDRDYDGVGDAQDNCPDQFNPDQRDDDLDGIGYVCDDADGDGVPNSRDNCVHLRNSNQRDTDGDGVGDACEIDRDSDGHPDEADNCRQRYNPDQSDRDDDGIGDLCDSCPDTENPEQQDQNQNGLGDACEAGLLDPDSDSVSNENDNCPAIFNPAQADTDNDGIGDVCDNCPTFQNADQRDSDNDGRGNVCSDADGDGLLPHIDNCPFVHNPDQEDRNNNGTGDACEDDDNDGVVNAFDNCRYESNRDQRDLDNDGQGNACDDSDDRLSEQHPWVLGIGMGILILSLLGLGVMMMRRIKQERS